MNDTGVRESTGDPSLDVLLARFEDDAATLARMDLTGLVRLDGPSTGLHAAARRVEAARRMLGGFDSAYVTAIEAGDEPARYARSTTANFLRQQLRLTRAEGRRRVVIAHACTPRPSFSCGEALPAPCPELATAIAGGQVSADHATVVLKALDALPAPVRAEHGPVVETELVTAALASDPAGVAGLGREVLLRADPDGTLRDHDYAHARRTFWMKANELGAGGRVGGDLDAETFEMLQTALSPLAKPVPATPDGDPAASPDGRDARSPGERNHDALRDLLVHSLNRGDLPACGGTPATIVFHIREDRLASQYGLAVTDHGQLIPIRDALAVADQSAIYVLITSCTNVPLWLGRTTRIATPGQTIALAARDRGCSFPGCDRPPAHCQRHHVKEWFNVHGPTDIDNLTLLCGYHHREFERRGWTCAMRDGHPWWTPPRWIDPEQKPVRNHHHVAITDTG
jgi:Domain of unknown function (DUF222)